MRQQIARDVVLNDLGRIPMVRRDDTAAAPEDLDQPPVRDAVAKRVKEHVDTLEGLLVLVILQQACS